MAEVDVLHARLPVAELGELQAAGEPAGLAFGPLAIDEQPDAVLDRERGVARGLGELCLERAGEAVEAQLTEFPKRLLGRHGQSSSSGA